ncbi:flagellar export protein FliJ [Bacterioplanes sanyensis]|uniref:flagellar export protein FliJ n=1 Tax=Bacterioplanes sanyensis TaxID=1249553 RepID=UPI0012FDE9A3|nr:flagellar export protein FliJ [Bacterioplanes sanyensis]
MARHPRAIRLQTVVKLAERDERQALANLGQAQQKLQAEQEQKQQLSDYANDYQQQLSGGHGGQLSAAQLHTTVGFLRQIEQALKQQQEQIVLLQKQVEHERGIWQQCQAKLKALHHLLDKLDQEYDEQQQRLEQHQADEWSNRAAFDRLKSR